MPKSSIAADLVDGDGADAEPLGPPADGERDLAARQVGRPRVAPPSQPSQEPALDLVPPRHPAEAAKPVEDDEHPLTEDRGVLHRVLESGVWTHDVRERVVLRQLCQLCQSRRGLDRAAVSTTPR